MSVTEWPPGEAIAARAVDVGALDWPLDDEALDDLRWYLEDYLRAPFGVYGERGAEVAGLLSTWGSQVFTALFGSGKGRDSYLRARARSDRLEIVLRSSTAQLLGLPWELMADPDRPSPLALDGVAISRTLSTGTPTEPFEVGDSRLRVLMVISRPEGTEDVGYRMIARPLLQRLEAVRGAVELVVLRPPTLARLGEVLQKARAAGQPFQIVHFDGHGALAETDGTTVAGRPAARRRPLTFQRPGPSGLLVFERPGGGPDPVPAERVARVLAEAEVPLVMLNACQSAAMGSQVEAAVATRLLQEGARAVIAMAYSVYAVAAAEFTTAFYERLFAGDRVAEAVVAGRRRLAAHDGRPSPKGLLPLADWMVPVLYTRSEVALPGLRTERENPESLDEILDRSRPAAAGRRHRDPTNSRDRLAPVGEFVGRDGLLLRADVAARRSRVVVLHGPGGVGKSELAKAFGRWSGDTGAVAGPGSVIWHSSEPGVASFGLAGLIGEAGRRLFRDTEKFEVLDLAEQQDAVEKALAASSRLLIWDNFESLCSMPDPTGATPALAEAELAAIRAFLERVARDDQSAVVITSRAREDWLGPVPLRIEVTGLEPEEAAEYADHLLAAYPGAARRRGQRAFGELMQWLGGHPLSMRLVLPHLAVHDPRQVLDALVQGRPRLLGDADGERNASLAASIAYSLAHLSDADRRALAALTLFHGVADVNLLGLLSQHPLAPERFRGHTAESWQDILRRAVGIGLLTESSEAAFVIHPALPALLSAQWRGEEADHADQREASLLALLDAQAFFCGLLGRELNRGDAEFAMAAMDVQRRTMGKLLGYALDRGLWQQALSIVRPLDDYWDIRGLYAESRGWVDRVRAVLDGADGTPPDPNTPAGELWLFLVHSEGNRQLRSGRIDQAEKTFREVHRAVERQSADAGNLDMLSVALQGLGRVSVEKGRLADAERWYRQSLAIDEQRGNQSGMAVAHHQISVIAVRQGRMADAEQACRQALAIFERRGDTISTARSYHQLGLIHQEQGRFAEAEQFYLRSLAISEQLADRPSTATLYHQLATMATDLGRLAQAEEWCRRSLAISEDLGTPSEIARSYHQLGMLAVMGNRLREAAAWHGKALEIRVALGDPQGTASSHHQLGIVATQHGDLEEAEAQYTLSREIREELNDLPGLTVSYHQLGMTAQQAGRPAEAETWYLRSLALAQELRDAPAMSRTFGQFALFVEEQGRPQEALELMVRSITCFEEFPHPLTWQSVANLRILTREHGMPALEKAWRSVTGHRLPHAVRNHVRS
ncbi:tetratricopeptide repeat protein [Kitasatospora sp. NPDC059327]|uniref:tetratricopeptide repeat protein n=1 Tax=Kitasatospora sp. NPDC059327 TaxID=3346803 RepID=UPI0036A2D9E2